MDLFLLKLKVLLGFRTLVYKSDNGAYIAAKYFSDGVFILEGPGTERDYNVARLNAWRLNKSNK